MDWDKMMPAEITIPLAKAITETGKAILEELKANPAIEPLNLPQDKFRVWPVELKAPETTRIYNNKMPTHDPYTNPNALIYYECGCGAILDPLTKSFASLNNHASNTGWKIRFGETGYTPYCVKCGEGVE